MIYNKSDIFPYGHVAIISEVNINEGYISVAEQNYLNEPWENLNKHSRKIMLFKNNEKYELIDVNNKNILLEILGWKRLVK